VTVPFFSILLPTRGRSEIVGGAIESVLTQTFTDFELIISDNDASDTATREVVSRYPDARIRYVRTNGNLSMHENWENVFNHASGSHCLILEDKMRLVPNALEILHHYLQKHGDVVISYAIKFAKEPQLPAVNPLPEATDYGSRETIEMFCCFSQKFFEILPKGLDSCAPRALLKDLKAKSPTGLLFSYISPDYASGFQILSAVGGFFHIAEPLVYVPNNWMWQGKFSNGQSSYRKTDAYKAFLATLPVTREEIVRAVPIKSEFLWINSVIYDFLKLYQKPGHAPEIDWPAYYSFCLILMIIAKKAGGNLREETAQLRAGLKTQSLRFRSRVLIGLAVRLAFTASQQICKRLVEIADQVRN
jgi:glycosyltransferase involved in cell wall biosynthesis